MSGSRLACSVGMDVRSAEHAARPRTRQPHSNTNTLTHTLPLPSHPNKYLRDGSTTIPGPRAVRPINIGNNMSPRFVNVTAIRRWIVPNFSAVSITGRRSVRPTYRAPT